MGKTTITKKLLDHARETSQDIRIFDGNARYLEVETDNFNTIVLGEENVQYQKNIIEIEKEIQVLSNKISTEIKSSIGERKESLESDITTFNKELEKMMSDKVREIRERYSEIGTFNRGHLSQMKPKENWGLEVEDV